jgi:hypothetical protein
MKTTRLPEQINANAPKGFNALIKEAARQEMMSQSEFVRRAIIEKMRRQGIEPRAA